MKVIYTGLAVLIGVGLIGFGVGSVGGGSLFESVSKEGKGSNSSYAAKVTAAKKKIAKNPNDAAAWIALTEAQLHEADSSESYNSSAGTYTAKGKEQLRRAASSWSSYVALNPQPVSLKLAKEVAVIFTTEGLNEPAKAVEVLQILVASEPNSPSLYSQLAEYSYLAHNERQGDLASKRAVALAPKSRRPLLESELERVKRSVNEKSSAATGGTAAAKATSTTSTTTSTTSTHSSNAKKK